MFSKSQRHVLNKLSDSIWCVETKWQKLYNAGHFDVVESETESEEAVTQVSVPNKGSRSGKATIYNKLTAMDKYLWGDTPQTTKVKRRVKRKPTYSELLNTLTDISKGVVYSKLESNGLVNALAMDLVSKNESVNVKLVKKDGDEYHKDFQDLLSRLPDDLQAKVTELAAGTNGAPIDAIEFVSEVIFITVHKDQALDVYNGNIENALARHKKELRKQSYQRRMGFA